MFAVVREWDGIEAVFSSVEKAEAYIAKAKAGSLGAEFSVEFIELDPEY